MPEPSLIDVTQLRIMAADTVLSVVSIIFGIISAYITGLFFFLNRAPFMLRSLAFALLSIAIFFVGAIALAVSPVAGGLVGPERAIDQSAAATISAIQRGDFTPALSLMDIPVGYLAGLIIGLGLFAAVYVALLYMTFFYRWPKLHTPA
jgi:hypothetical protein